MENQNKPIFNYSNINSFMIDKPKINTKLKNGASNNKKEEFIFTSGNASAGKGFGNLDIMANIRFGDASRNEREQFREEREGKESFDFKFSYLNKDFQNPNNIVMPIPRGGEPTRDQNQLQIDTMRISPIIGNTIKKDIKNENPIIKFNY
jgi:hypothetical protein